MQKTLRKRLQSVALTKMPDQLKPIRMSRDTARLITFFLTVALCVGTLMPGSWKDAALSPFPRVINLAAVAHIVLFAGICFMMAPARFWNVKSWHVLTIGLSLALATEGLQFFAVGRHPNLAGVLQDMIGAVLGLAFGRLRGK
jgi:hypothetical protein